MITFTGNPVNSQASIDIGYQGANNVISNITLAAFGMNHCWRNVSAAEGTNVLTMILKCGATNTNISVTVTDGDYTINELCATIETLLQSSYGAMNIDGAGADTQTWAIEANAVVSGNTVAAKTVSTPTTGRVTISFENNGVTVGSAMSLFVANTGLSRMLGFYASVSSSDLGYANIASGTTQYVIVTGSSDYDVRFASIHPAIIIALEGVAQGVVQNQLAGVSGTDVKAYPVLGVVPLTNVRFQEPIEYDNTRVNMAPRAVQSVRAGVLNVKFQWENGSPVNFAPTTQVFLQLLIVHQPLDSLSLATGSTSQQTTGVKRGRF